MLATCTALPRQQRSGGSGGQSRLALLAVAGDHLQAPRGVGAGLHMTQTTRDNLPGNCRTHQHSPSSICKPRDIAASLGCVRDIGGVGEGGVRSVLCA